MNSKNESDAPLTIEPVTLDVLEASTRDGKIDPGTAELLAAERAYVCKRRQAFRSTTEQDISSKGVPGNLVGLALSGGGIRSATFSLGVMQALSRNGFLDKVDYLSTVSGGGYIGSAVTWLTSDLSASAAHQGKFSTRKNEFPFGTDDPDPESEKIDRPEQEKVLRYLRQHGNYLAPGAGISLVSLLGVVLRGTLLNLLVWMPLFGVLFYIAPEPLYDGLVYAGLLIFAGLIVAVIVYSFATWLRRLVPFDLFWYWSRRRAEQAAAILIPLAILLLVIGYLPDVDEFVWDRIKAAGPAAILTGIGVAIRSFLTSGSSEKGAPVGIVVPLASALFLYGVVLVSFQIGTRLYPMFPLDVPFVGISVPLFAIIVAAVALGIFVNLNYIAIHRYYRDRLMETFMPDLDSAMSNDTTAAIKADSAKFSTFAQGEDNEIPRAPYHIVNTNLILVNSDTPTYASRGGDNFIMSPEYCGSNATGWRRTSQFMRGKMTLATAVAISGAAANPNSGVGGEGLTRNKFLSLVMSLLNLKLGYWASNPHKKHHTNWPANHFVPGSYSIGNAIGIFGFRENRTFVQLSDGGHFENTGVYELVRRRLRLIVVCDGGADPDTSFSDFQTTVRRVEDDFGALIEVDETESPNKVVPTIKKDLHYPKDRKYAEQGFMRGTVTYADGTTGTIIYLKTTLISSVSFKVKGYAASNPDFPDQSTADQFFDEVQFEAYRELGHAIASQMLDSRILDEPADKKELTA